MKQKWIFKSLSQSTCEQYSTMRWEEERSGITCESRERKIELFSLNISYHKTIESGEFISLGVVWCVITVYESKSNGIAFFFCYLFIQSETTGRKPTKTDLRSEAKKRKEYICWSCRKRFWFVSFTPAECELAIVCVCVCARRAWQISWSTVRAKPQHSFDYVVFVSFRLH